MKQKLFITLLVICMLSFASSLYAESSIFSPQNGTGTIINANSGISGNGTGPNPSGVTSSFVSNDITASRSAATTSSGSCHVPTNIGELFNYALCILDSSVVPFLVGLGLILFLAGVLRFVSSGDNEEARQGGRNMMMFGIISLFVMVSIWGFVNILSRTFFGTDSEIQSLPRKSATVFKQ